MIHFFGITRCFQPSSTTSSSELIVVNEKNIDDHREKSVSLATRSSKHYFFDLSPGPVSILVVHIPQFLRKRDSPSPRCIRCPMSGIAQQDCSSSRGAEGPSKGGSHGDDAQHFFDSFHTLGMSWICNAPKLGIPRGEMAYMNSNWICMRCHESIAI